MPSLESMAKDAERVLAKLAQEATERARTRDGKNKPRQPQSALYERNVAVLFGTAHGWSDPLIAKRFHMSRNTVLRTRRRFDENPTSVFRVPILHQDISGTRQVWRCEVCLARMGGTERKARTHVLNHYVSKDAMMRGGVLDEDRIW